MDGGSRLQKVQRLARHSDLELTQQIHPEWEMLVERKWRAAERSAW